MNMPKSHLVIRFIDTINIRLGKVVCILFIPLTCISLFEVLMRYVFNKPTIWAWDLNMQIFAALVMLGGGYTLSQDSHVSVDVFVMKMLPRRKAMLDIITSAIFFFGMIILIYKGAEIGWSSFVRGERDATIWGPPIWTIKMLVPIGAFFVFLQGISKFLRAFILLRTGKDEYEEE